jgi:hypothetical protein
MDGESTRRAVLSLSQEAKDQDMMGWAREMRAWYSLTQGDYKAVVGKRGGRTWSQCLRRARCTAGEGVARMEDAARWSLR